MLPRRLPGMTILPPGDGVLQRELSRLQELSAQSLPAYLEDLATLVGTDCGSYSKPGVDRVGRSTVRFLERLGATVTVHPNVDLGDTVVGTIEGTPGGPRLLLIGHLDTVFPDGTAAGRPSLAGPGPIGGNDHAPHRIPGAGLDRATDHPTDRDDAGHRPRW